MTQPSASFKKQALLFFTSQCITLLGSQIVQMAIVWYVTLQTGSGAWVAAFSVFSYLPQFFVSFPGGVWTDRYNQKFLIIAADAFIALITLIMLLLLPSISSQPLLLTGLLILSFLRSAACGIQIPCVNAVIPRLIPADSLMRYNGINASMQSLVQFASPAAAAVILTSFSLSSALLLDILTAALGISLFACLSLPKQPEKHASSSVFSDMTQGMRYASSCRPVRISLFLYAAFTFLCVPAGYLSGLLVSRVFGDTYWYLTATELSGFGGMMIGGLLLSLWGGFKRQNVTLAGSLSLFSFMAAAMGVSRHFIPYLVFMFFYGIALTGAQTTLTSLLQQHADSSMHGRVFGLMSSLYAAFYPLGMAVFGPLADYVSLRFLMILSAAALLLLALFAYRTRCFAGGIPSSEKGD